MCSITFESPIIETMFTDILKFMKKHKIECFIEEVDVDFEKIELENINDSISSQLTDDLYISSELEIVVVIPRGDTDQSFTLEALEEIIQIAEKGKLLNYERFISPSTVLVHVDYQRPRFEELNKIEYTISQSWGNKTINISLEEGFTAFGMFLLMEGEYDKYTPPVFEEDLFIEIYSPEGIDLQEVEAIIQSYIFECGTTLSLNLTPTPRPTSYDFFYVDQEDQEVKKELKLRPLIQGKGINEVLNIYNSGNEIHNAEFLVLTYTKVIEYVSQTVLRKEMLDSVTKKLYSPRALSPDSTFILELEKLYDEHRNHSKDHQAIKLTVQTCCDITDIESVAPKYLKNLNLEKLAGAISDTRNMIAHAKTNYRFKGQECPSDQMDQFAQCLKVVAYQTIRWFARQHEDSRII